MTHAAHPQPVALVTGASSGIGQATATALTARGFRVFGTSRTPVPDPALPFALLPLDVRSDASVQDAVQHVLAAAGRIDVLVNNAGYAQLGGIEETSVADVQAQFDTNVFGVLRVTNAVLPIMRRQRAGRIINVSSLLGQVAPPFMGVYAGSKFAVEGLTEALRSELQPFGIHVSLVEPGSVKTNLEGRLAPSTVAEYDAARQAMLNFARQGVEQGMDAADVARAIVGVATAPRPGLRHRVGRVSNVLITLKRLLPEPLFERLLRRAFAARQVAPAARQETAVT